MGWTLQGVQFLNSTPRLNQPDMPPDMLGDLLA
jgi:hypothetical protein